MVGQDGEAGKCRVLGMDEMRCEVIRQYVGLPELGTAVSQRGKLHAGTPYGDR